MLYTGRTTWSDVELLHPINPEATQSRVLTEHVTLREVTLKGLKYILRVSQHEPIADEIEDQTTESILTLSVLQRKHLAVLATTELRIPPFQSFVGESPVSDEPALFNLVQKIEVDDVGIHNFDARDIIARSLKQYLAWVDVSKQPHVLDDIYDRRQYGVDQADNVWLLDIEPSFVRTDIPDELYVFEFMRKAKRI
jgi:hypothetical protein